MRSTVEIIVAVKESQPVTEEELRMALLVMSSVDHFLRHDLRRLCDVVEKNQPKDFFAHCARRTLDSMFGAIKTDPLKWLGPSNLPGTPEYEQRMRAGKAIFRKATGLDLDAPTPPQAQPCALVLDPEERAALLQAARMFDKTPGEGPYLEALKRVIQRLDEGGAHGAA